MAVVRGMHSSTSSRGLLDSSAISVNLGNRNLSLVLDHMSDTEIAAATASLEQAIEQLRDYVKK